MRLAVVSDVHSNLEALEAVLDAIDKVGVDQILCAGDMVGYGADPSACLRLLQERVGRAVLGNHDSAAVGEMALDWFNEAAAAAVRWTRDQLSPLERGTLQALELTWQSSDGEVSLAHGSLHEPDKFHYLLDLNSAAQSFQVQKTPVAFIGHTHVPGVFREDGSKITFAREGEFRVKTGVKYLVNVGSVGQPRDGDPRAAFCLYDTAARTIEIRRVAYLLSQTQAKIRKAGLPEFLAERLAFGY